MPCRAFFSLCGAFSFCAGVLIYAAIRSEALKRFFAALRVCFSFRVAFVVLLFVLVFSVMAQILLVLRFVGVGGILYRAIFFVACSRFILALNGIPLFYHIFPYYTTIFYHSAIFRSEVGSNGRLLFWTLA